MMFRWIRCLCVWFVAAASGLTYADEPVRVVASFSILGDLVREVGGDRVSVVNLVGPNEDSHSYQPTPADSRTIQSADLVFINGLGYEGWIDRLIRSSGFRGVVVTVSSGVKPLSATRHGRQHHGVDPHAWQSVPNVIVYVDNIAKALSRRDPTRRAIYRKNADRYQAQLRALDDQFSRRFSAIPAPQRRILTAHNAFAYLGNRYGIETLALAELNAGASISAAEMAGVVARVRAAKVAAMFAENADNPKLIAQIARETGAVVGGVLYSDALSGSDGPAPNYMALMRHNVDQIVAALTKAKEAAKKP